MAKKTENKTKELAAVTAAAENTAAASGTAAEVQEAAPGAPEGTAEAPTATPEEQEPVTGGQDDTPESQEPEQEVSDSIARMEEMLNNDIETLEEEPPQEDGQQDAEPLEEKILFYIRTVNDKTAIRSTPEYKIDNSNVSGIIEDRFPRGITEVAEGFGRLAGGMGWILLDPGVVIRQG